MMKVSTRQILGNVDVSAMWVLNEIYKYCFRLSDRWISAETLSRGVKKMDLIFFKTQTDVVTDCCTGVAIDFDDNGFIRDLHMEIGFSPQSFGHHHFPFNRTCAGSAHAQVLGSNAQCHSRAGGHL